MTFTRQILTSCPLDAVDSPCGPHLPVPSPSADLLSMAEVRLVGLPIIGPARRLAWR